MKSATKKQKAVKLALQKPMPNGNIGTNKRRRRTKAEVAALEAYIEELRRWLDAVPDEDQDEAIAQLTSEELFFINAFETYDNYWQGGLMREVIDPARLLYPPKR